jgi:hypothetical protein
MHADAARVYEALAKPATSPVERRGNTSRNSA